ncbi:TonB dependent receptor [Cyclobacterium lianum]|uniref:TonB dependent receptor n=1 Tax=Cyclobacterium lianum TaxID=388280 RepID=A0A1M7M5M1_9BACT|nr:TonB-dependent receptor [Cyclobacterium lianum]SHM85937.1 TonB dependent receptor [Cyclobacterium lianum]
MNQIKALFVVGCSLLGMLASCPIQAQDQQEPGRGEIRDTEFIIRKDRVLSLPRQSRVFEKSPSLPPVAATTSFSYQVKDFFVPLEPVVLETQAYQKPFPRPAYGQTPGNAKLGFGNYSSPLIHLDYHHLPDSEKTYGLHLKHQGFYTGPVDGSNSAEDHTEVGLSGSLFRDFLELYGNLDFERDMYHFYGYTPDPEISVPQDSIRQVFNTLKTRLGIKRIDRSEPFDYGASLSLRLFNDRYAARESEALVKVRALFRASENLKGGIDSRLAFTSPSDQNYEAINRNYFKLHPYAQYTKDGLHVEVGANVIHENDIVPNKLKEFYVFPSAFLSYHVVPQIGAYARYEGDVKRNTYYDFVMENPFLGPSDQLRNTVQNYLVDAGISGKINGETNYEVGLRYGDYTNMHFYGNNMADSTRFQLIYDNNTRVMEYHATLDYKFEQFYQLQASAQYFQYTLDEINSAWHRPEWEIHINNTFTPDPKWTIHANMHALGGIQAINLASDSQRKLSPILDLHLSVDYAFTEKFSAFLQGNNLLNQSYERFNYYPVRSIQVIGGIGFKF